MGKIQSYMMLMATFLVLGLLEEIIIRLIMKSHFSLHIKIILVMAAIGIAFITVTEVIKPHIRSILHSSYRTLKIREAGFMGKWLAFVILFIIIYILYYLIFFKNLI